ncbi:hypothetical protein LP419_27380 [Massilia sp. H-1]|nr:hypothetical protein LP419_27380 [Massilia sp. H-1]
MSALQAEGGGGRAAGQGQRGRGPRRLADHLAAPDHDPARRAQADRFDRAA